MVFGFIGLLLAIVIFLFPKRIYTPEESSVIEKKEKIDEIIKL